MINAYGGKLVNRVTNTDPSGLFSIDISTDLANDVENIADGIFSPHVSFFAIRAFPGREKVFPSNWRPQATPGKKLGPKNLVVFDISRV